MCGIFGQISKKSINYNNITKLAKHSSQRGRDASGLICYKNNNYKIYKANYNIKKLLKFFDKYFQKKELWEKMRGFL